jgi:hypothetical protein
MDELDEPTHPPITLPRPKLDLEIESPARVADGTQTNLGAAPRARATMPPPIPAAARRAKATMPPPIPAAALAAKPRGTTSSTNAAPPDNLPIDPVIAPPIAAQSVLPSTITIVADIDVPITHDEEPVTPELPLPPLPRPSQDWLVTTAQPPPVRTDEPRRRIATLDLKPALDHDDDSATPLPPPAPASDSGDEWPVIAEPRVEVSAVSDLFAPASPEPGEPADEPSDASKLFARTSEPDIETSATVEPAERPADLFALPPVEEPATSYFERTATYNKRHLAAVGVAAIVVAALAAVVVRSALKPSTKLSTLSPVAIAAAPVKPVATPTPAPEPVAPPTPEPAAAPEPVPAQAAPAEAAPAPAHPLADIPVTSTPSGAIVTLIENGTPRVLGKTPVFASIDRSQSYDVVVALSGHPTSMQHLDPHVTSQIAVSFDGSHVAPAPAPAHVPAPPAPAAPAEVAAAAPAPAAPAEHHHHRVEARVAAADPAPSAPSPSPSPSSHRSWNVAPAAKPVVAETAGTANGVLMVASKPPCEIVIDGHPTKLETPQRSIALAPGTHAVTLINAKMHINKTVPVQVAANKPTKLIRDFTH